MPRRDVVLTGLIAFGAGVAVGANWPKLRRKIGPMLEKLGLQMADLGDFLSEHGMEDFAPGGMKAAKKAGGARSRRRPAKAEPSFEEFFRPAAVGGKKRPARAAAAARKSARPSKRRSPRARPVVIEAEAPRATGTFGA